VVRLGAVVAGVAAIVAVSAGGALADTASDGRATFGAGSTPTSCDQAAGSGEVQLGSSGPTGDTALSATVGLNTGSLQPGVGQELDITLLNPFAVLHVVIVGGTGGYNRYVAPSLPPTLATPQHYLAPLDATAKVPPITTWLACYTIASSYIDVAGVVVTSPKPVGTPLAFTGSTHTLSWTAIGFAALTLGLALVLLARHHQHH
jgi:hypothetical protein